jgi:hypothetical protein
MSTQVAAGGVPRRPAAVVTGAESPARTGRALFRSHRSWSLRYHTLLYCAQTNGTCNNAMRGARDGANMNRETGVGGAGPGGRAACCSVPRRAHRDGDGTHGRVCSSLLINLAADSSGLPTSRSPAALQVHQLKVPRLVLVAAPIRSGAIHPRSLPRNFEKKRQSHAYGVEPWRPGGCPCSVQGSRRAGPQGAKRPRLVGRPAWLPPFALHRGTAVKFRMGMRPASC